MNDSIERDKAIEKLKENVVEMGGDDFSEMGVHIDDIESVINSIPSARPKGEWKPKNHHTDYCSNCGFEETQWRTADYNFCPSCGARMKGMDDEHIV